MYVEYSKTKVYVDFMKLDINKRETEKKEVQVFFYSLYTRS